MLVAAVALTGSIIGGVAGYGTGALMPLVLVPILGPEPVVPIIAMSGVLTNSGRVFAFLRLVDWRRAAIALIGAVPFVIVSAYGFTLLTGKAVQILIGVMLILTVPLRYAMRRRATVLGDGGLLFSSMGYGAVMGGTVGAGVILLSILMSAGLQGAAVIATDAVISIVVGIVRLSVFGYTGVITTQVVAFGLLIGVVGFTGAFLAKAVVERLPVRVHTAILDAVVLVGGVVLVVGALSRG
ncbi:MAG: sulfite exporter TauE/SafE family protein [Tardiphaga sp.]